MDTGFQINEAFYRMPEAFRMGDPVLVEEVTGMSWGEFTDRLDEPEGDPVVMLGMLAVAVWQTNPRWRRDRVARWVEAIDIADVKFIGGETEEDASPPPVTEAAPISNGSTDRSSVPPDSNSDTTQPSTTPAGSPPTIPVSA